MPIEKTIRGKRCRVYHDGYTWMWVADTGDFAAHYDAGGRYHGSFSVLYDFHGPFVQDSLTKRRISLDKAVITCFCPPKPGPGYMINHKDGNWKNSNYRNLEWTPFNTRHSALPKERLFLYGEFVEVSQSGVVNVGGKAETICDNWFDGDVERIWVTSFPYITISRNRVKMDNIMGWAGYVQSDSAGLQVPVVLHIDEAPMNFASSNLEWTEKTDERYRTYLSALEKWRREKLAEYNPGKQLPAEWI